MVVVWRLCGYSLVIVRLQVYSVFAMGVWGERLKAISGEDIAFRVSELTSY